MKNRITLIIVFTFLLGGLSLLEAQEIPLTGDAYNHECPEWSPDGSEIVYQKEDATTYWQIYKIASTGGSETALTSDNYNHGGGSQWSPDGSEIVYQKEDATGYWQIYRIASTGGSETALINDGYSHSRPPWSGRRCIRRRPFRMRNGRAILRRAEKSRIWAGSAGAGTRCTNPRPTSTLPAARPQDPPEWLAAPGSSRQQHRPRSGEGRPTRRWRGRSG